MPPVEPHPLAPIDELLIGHAFSIVLRYAERLDEERLTASLATVLGHIPPLACSLRVLEDGGHGFAPLRPAPQWLQVVESPLLPESLNEPPVLSELLPRLRMGMGQPLLSARLTQAPSGSVLGVTLAHAVADGYSFFAFLRAWSRATLGRSIEPLPWARPPPDSAGSVSTMALTPEDVWRRTGFSWRPPGRALDTPQPASFGARLIPPEPRSLAGGAPLSDNDLLCAWLLQTHADALAGPERLSFVLPVDYRRSHGGLAQNYFGNAIRGAPLRLTRQELGGTLPTLAARIQDAIRGVLDERGARDSIACLERLGREQGPSVFQELHLVDPSEGFLVTNVSRLPFGMLDFGRGPPVSTLLPAVEERTAVIQQTDEGFEVSVLLPAARR